MKGEDRVDFTVGLGSPDPDLIGALDQCRFVKVAATCYLSVADETKETGTLYEDREVVVDGNLVTSRYRPISPHL